ncbi:SMI1/KNR4 family protein [Gordonia paraffinivorans]|nr:SMI1/KNR4 family protein [Gordonia paraffinivorans]
MTLDAGTHVPDDWAGLLAALIESTRHLMKLGLLAPLENGSLPSLRPPATPAQIAEAEGRLGERLDVHVRELLQHTNGCDRLDGEFSLLSCEELGGPDWTKRVELRDAYWESWPRDSWPTSLHVDPHRLIPIMVAYGTRSEIHSTPATDPLDLPRPVYDVGLDPVPDQTLKQALQTSLRLNIEQLAGHYDSSQEQERA